MQRMKGQANNQASNGPKEHQAQQPQQQQQQQQQPGDHAGDDSTNFDSWRGGNNTQHHSNYQVGTGEPYPYYAGTSFPYQTFGAGDGTWSNGTESVAFLSGYGGQISHDAYGMDQMFPTGAGGGYSGFGQPAFNYFPGNGDFNAWGTPRKARYEDYYPQPRSNDGYQGGGGGGGTSTSAGGGEMKTVDQGVQGLSIGELSRHEQQNITTGQINKTEPKEQRKITWASVASQPAKPIPPAPTNQGMKKKAGMPPPPIIPGKHNMDIGTWGEGKSSVPPPPKVPLPPQITPPVVAPIPVIQRERAPPAGWKQTGSSGLPSNQEEQKQQQQQQAHPQNQQQQGSQSQQRQVQPQSQQQQQQPQQHARQNQVQQQKQQGSHQGQHEKQSPQPQNQQQQQNTSANQGHHQQIGSGGHQQASSPPKIHHSMNQNHQHNQHDSQSPPHHHQQKQQQQQQPQQHHQQYQRQQSSPSQSTTQTVANTDDSKAKNDYNPPDFDQTAPGAKFFVIKSYSEDDIHRSIKYEIWCSTEHGNKRLDQAFREANREGAPLYLFFSVNGSGHFCGMAQMVSPVDYHSNSSVWSQDKWKGQFRVRWIYVKDVPNVQLRHIKLENNENKSVTNSRDAQEVPHTQGINVLRILHSYRHSTSIFDDFGHYEKRQAEEDQRKVLPPSMHRQQQQQHSPSSPPPPPSLSSSSNSGHRGRPHHSSGDMHHRDREHSHNHHHNIPHNHHYHQGHHSGQHHPQHHHQGHQQQRQHDNSHHHSHNNHHHQRRDHYNFQDGRGDGGGRSDGGGGRGDGGGRGRGRGPPPSRH